ncbi:TRAP transporter substrate-binding protein [Paracoccus sp. SCSIO 75233]|uniref:TRAP transporter substrate-binding protein n=1 Tax=Paracoccus sp. SCSIO 75233 TaxID=3017782 RepID=UPI0022F01E4F|nr:TRAP transporter substrate-binding protein [Paracoccus sp. SCSIO 75233]WBU53086.1 TRAP transporter substrate-binding protein [Paracoccus sp. SCSIO 75233]
MKHLFIGALTAAALLAGSASAETLRLAHNAAPGNPKDLASERFAELVAEKTEGRITVDAGGSAQYGDDVEALTQMRLGTLALSANSQGPASGVVEEFAVLGLPFLFDSLEQAWEVLDGEVGQKLDEAAQENGLKVLAFWDNGIRQTSNNVRPINTPDDLAGLKIRTPPDPMTLEIFTTLGANPTPMAFSELYVALQQGVVDGQENPLMNIESSKLYEVQKYISLTGHKYESTPLLMSKIVWDGLSEEDQAAMLEAAKEAGEYNRELSKKSDEELRPMLEEAGVEFNELDTAPFVEATQPIIAEWQEKYPDLVGVLMTATGR